MCVYYLFYLILFVKCTYSHCVCCDIVSCRMHNKSIHNVNRYNVLIELDRGRHNHSLSLLQHASSVSCYIVIVLRVVYSCIRLVLLLYNIVFR